MSYFLLFWFDLKGEVFHISVYFDNVLGIHLKVSAASIQLLESAQCTAHLNGFLAKVQARFCIDMPPLRECTSGTMTNINRYMKNF